MSRHGTYDPKHGFIPDDDCPQTYLCDSCTLYPCWESGVKIERRCPAYNPIPKPQTNADKLRSMTDEELAELLTAVAQKSANKLCESLKTLKTVDVNLSNCDFDILYKAHLDWLKREAID